MSKPNETVFERILRLAAEQRAANQEQRPLSARLEHAVKMHEQRHSAAEYAARTKSKQP